MLPIDRPYARWLELVTHILRQPTITLPHDLVADEIRRTFDCPSVAFIWPNGSVQPGLKIWPDSFRSLEQQYTPGMDRLNPLCNYYRITGDPGARCTSEVPSRIAGRRGFAAWWEFSDPWQLHYQLGLPLSASAPGYHAFSVGRSSGPFTRQERELARSLQPLLAAVDRQAAVLRRRQPQPIDPLLTGRERAVLILLAQGITAASIGQRLGITPRTVTKHLERVYTKLQVNNRVAAVVTAQRAGILPNPQPPTHSTSNEAVGIASG